MTWLTTLGLREAGPQTRSPAGRLVAASMMSAILEVAARTNVIIYDPQADEVIHPPAGQSGGKFFKRASRSNVMFEH